jgi:hypothetical protein
MKKVVDKENFFLITSFFIMKGFRIKIFVACTSTQIQTSKCTFRKKLQNSSDATSRSFKVD